jgi:hypothetical protein
MLITIGWRIWINVMYYAIWVHAGIIVTSLCSMLYLKSLVAYDVYITKLKSPDTYHFSSPCIAIYPLSYYSSGYYSETSWYYITWAIGIHCTYKIVYQCCILSLFPNSNNKGGVDFQDTTQMTTQQQQQLAPPVTPNIIALHDILRDREQADEYNSAMLRPMFDDLLHPT